MDDILTLLESEYVQGFAAGGIITAILGYIRHRQIMAHLRQLAINVQDPLAVLITGTMRHVVDQISSRKQMERLALSMKEAARNFDLRGYPGEINSVIHRYESAFD